MLGYSTLTFLLLESLQMTAEIITSQVFVLVLTYLQFIQNLHYRHGMMEVASCCVNTDQWNEEFKIILDGPWIFMDIL